MKKFQKSLPLILFVLALSLSGLSGCQIFSNKQAEEGDVDHTPRDRRIGVIQSLGTVKTNNQGTNLLIMEDGTTVLLKSLAINLDDTKFVNKKVEVSGVLTYTTDGKQIMEVESTDILDDAPVTQQQVIVSWRDYVNAGLGFRVKYRDDFIVDDDNQMISFTRPVSNEALMALVAMSQESSSSMEVKHDHVITISAKTHAADETVLKDVLKLANDSSTTLLAAGYNKSRIGMDGIEAYKRVSTDGKSVTFHFDADGRFYQVSYVGGSDSQSLEDQNIFYDFLASFQLLNGSVPTTQEQKEDTMVKIEAGADATDTGSVGSAMETEDEDFPEDKDTPASSTTNPTTPAATSSLSITSTTGTTQEALPGYSTFTSSGYKFTLQYPKSWYYGQASSSDSDVIRRYDFGSKPLDEQAGSVNLDIVSGSVPSGLSTTVNGKTLVMVSSGTTVSYYYKDANGRTYKVTGPTSMDGSLRTMASTITEQ